MFHVDFRGDLVAEGGETMWYVAAEGEVFHVRGEAMWRHVGRQVTAGGEACGGRRRGIWWQEGREGRCFT